MLWFWKKNVKMNKLIIQSFIFIYNVDTNLNILFFGTNVTYICPKEIY